MGIDTKREYGPELPPNYKEKKEISEETRRELEEFKERLGNMRYVDGHFEEITKESTEKILKEAAKELKEFGIKVYREKETGRIIVRKRGGSRPFELSFDDTFEYEARKENGNTLVYLADLNGKKYVKMDKDGRVTNVW